MALNKIKQGSIGQSAVTSDNIVDGTIVNADISPSAAIASAKVPGIGTLCTTATSINATVGAVEQNIALLGFKMAVNDGLTVFNLVDGVVDEFHDESGTDESEGSNDHYCATNDIYSNNNSCSAYSAGFSSTAITEPDTSVTQTNPTFGSGTFGQFTVPTGMTSANIFLWGAGGGVEQSGPSGGGGFTEGTLAVTGSQVLEIVVGEGGLNSGAPTKALGGGGGNTEGSPYDIAAPGGGLAGVFTNCEGFPALQANAPKAPQVYLVAAGGGGAGFTQPNSRGGAGGGQTGNVGGPTEAAQTCSSHTAGGGGDQEQGGQSANPDANRNGAFLRGGEGGSNDAFNAAGGGGGYYGGGGGFFQPNSCAGGGGGGGGSSYFGHPQITSGATTRGGAFGTPQAGAGYNFKGGGTSNPNYVAGTNEGWSNDCGPEGAGEDGYVLITGNAPNFGAPGGGSTTLISTAFTSTSVPTTSRIVVFEENVDTPTLNTDIIASISRDGGSTFTNATLSDSGYVTGSSGQRILTGQATISGQPSGQSMRWKLALANNTVKIHGVALQWS